MERNLTKAFALPVPKASGDPDLSVEIARMVQRLPGELVRCRRVARNSYRCNWLAPEPAGQEEGVARFLRSYRIRDSKFLRAVRVDGRVIIEDQTAEVVRSN